MFRAVRLVIQTVRMPQSKGKGGDREQEVLEVEAQVLPLMACAGELLRPMYTRNLAKHTLQG